MLAFDVSRFSLGLAALFAICLPLTSNLATAAPTPEQRREVTAIETGVTKAGNFYRQGKLKEAAEVIKEVQGKIEKLAAGADADVAKLLVPALARLQKAHELLEVEGIELPPLPKIDVAAAPPATPNPARPNPAVPPAAGGGVSFVKQVAPMLVAKCGRCHVGDSKGMFSMATYATLMTGPKGNRVIFPGDANDSHIVKVIAEGDMPRGGLKVAPNELDLLKKWIAEGAKFDGPDPQANISTLTSANPAAPAMPAIPVVVAKATGKESVSFSRDIAPHLASNCLNCHGNTRPRAMFNLTTFEGLLKGGESGANVLPGKPTESLLVQKLKGMAGDRMPLNLPPFSDELIAKIEKWIAEGARFDGDSATMPIKRIADLAIAKHSTHEELAQMRVESADRSWRLAMAQVESNKITTANFHIVGNVGENTLKQISEQAEEQMAKLAEQLKLPADKPFIKGKLTLFIFDTRYDYGEFGKMVEGRTLPTSWRGHFKFDVVNAYAAMFPSKAGDYSLPALLTQEIASSYVASLGDVPDWYAEGYGRVTAARLDAKDPRVAAWDSELAAALQTMSAPDDFITGKSSPDTTALAAYSFVKYLMADARRTTLLLDGIKAGESFDAAFTKAYGGTPSQRSMDWAKKGISLPRAGKK